MKKKIDLAKYKRASLYEAFKGRDMPCFSTTSNIEITKLKSYLDERSLGFFIPISFLISKAINEIKEMRHRIIDGELYEFEKVNPGYTILLDDETFSFCDSLYFEKFDKYQKYADAKISETKKVPDHGTEEKHDMFFISNLPWFSFTSIVHPYTEKYSSLPLISIGKYFHQDNQLLLPVGIQVHHGLVDGIHVGKFYNELSDMCSSPETFLAK
ncbi:MAG: chloramphenicol acetyltransferase [Desulfotalea sp.]